MPQKPPEINDLLQVLESHEVEYVVVGALAAALQGCPPGPMEFEILHRRTTENVQRPVTALASVHACYRTHPYSRYEPELEPLMSDRHHLLATDLGGIDILGTLDSRQGFEQIAGRTVEISLPSGVRVRVLNLEAIIESKRQAGRPKDLAALPVLEETLREIRRREGEE